VTQEEEIFAGAKPPVSKEKKRVIFRDLSISASITFCRKIGLNLLTIPLFITSAETITSRLFRKLDSVAFIA
jgi:hypothetical protein